jgi:hypothetical protein
VFELLGRAGEVADREDQVRTYESALAAFMRREFQSAADQLAEQVTVDPPSAVLNARCVTALAHPPAADWDGSRRLDEK